MPWPECRHGALLRKDLRDLLRARSYWAMLGVLSPLAGYSFIQAARLYSEASRGALQSPAAARALSPLDGVLVPTFGAVYLALTLLWPFVAIRALGAERQTGSLKLLLQLPVGRGEAVAVKAAASLLAGAAAFLPLLPALALWSAGGGHLAAAETANLFLGYALYGAAVTGLAFLASALSESVSAAAVAALTMTLASWVLDFASAAEGTWVRRLSLTTALRAFERGLLPVAGALHLLIVAGAAFALAAAALAPAPWWRRARAGAGILVLAALLGAASAKVRTAWDVSEDRRNSFAPAEERALAALREPLRITVHLSPDDSRLKDMERATFDKLRRLVPRLSIEYPDAAGGADDKDYGWIVYEYGGRADRSTSNSEEEILPLLHALAGQAVPADSAPEYPGYPLAADFGASGVLFYALLPAACVLAALGARGRLGKVGFRRLAYDLKSG